MLIAAQLLRATLFLLLFQLHRSQYHFNRCMPRFHTFWCSPCSISLLLCMAQPWTEFRNVNPLRFPRSSTFLVGRFVNNEVALEVACIFAFRIVEICDFLSILE